MTEALLMFAKDLQKQFAQIQQEVSGILGFQEFVVCEWNAGY